MKLNKGLSDAIGIVIVTSVILVVGIGLWSLLNSYTGVTRNEEVRRLGDQAMVLRSNIGADYVFYPDRVYGLGRGVISVRNVGREPVVVFRMLTINNGSIVSDTGITELARIRPDEFREIYFSCPADVCREGDPITVQVHYIPESLFNPSNPELSKHDSGVILFKIASFEAKPSIVSSGAACSLNADNWVIVELVDPKEDNIYGQTTDFVKIRVLNASAVLPSYDFNVFVNDGNGVEATGFISVTGPLPQEVYVQLDTGGLAQPLNVRIVSATPGLAVVPVDWQFPNSFGNYIDYTKLRIDLTRYRLDEVILSSGFYENGLYEFIVEIYDCRGVLISSGRLAVNVTVGSLAGYFEQYSIVLSPPVNIFDIGFIRVRSVDLTPVVTVTATVTQTSTVTSTTTTTVLTTVTTTETTTTTTTTTSTRTIPTTTVTTTRTITRTATVTSSTATLSVTRTTTSFTYTSTITRSTTTTFVSTSYSPTITLTQTSTQTSYTTTRTTTSTSTSILTQTTTVTTTTTTTVTGGSGGNMQMLIASDRWFSHPTWLIYYLLSSSALIYPFWRWFRYWMVRRE
ncbi:MAG: hypothetical protein QXR26_03255 [Candidatus Caldarchaeum sp.]